MKIREKTIPSAGPSVTQKEIELVTEAVTKGWYEDRNMHFDQFTKEFSKYTGAKYCLPTCNCTAALHLAMLGLDIKKGDEVIVPDMTWVASAAPAHYIGAVPVFADIDKESWCLSPESFEKAITPKTKAVVVVDLYGNMPEMDKIKRIAKENNIKIIEDAAESIGAEYKGKKGGTFGDVNVFSFNATKLTMAGQGGVLTTNDEKIFEKVKQLAHHGMVKYTPETTFWSEKIGYNYQWTNIQAALALAQLRRIDELVDFKIKAFNWYKSHLKDIEGLQLNQERDDIKNTFWVVTGILNKEPKIKKEDLMKEFKKYNIDTRPFFYPISSMPAYEQYVQGKNMKSINPTSYNLSKYGISFPSSFKLTEEDVEYVCQAFKEILNKHKF